MHKIQAQFWLEPAGSHGVWGLDDFHFIPFIFGSGQLLNDREVRPLDIHDYDIVDMYKDTNYYFRQISTINRVKTSSLRWHSPMLDDISGVKKWTKVNEGMIKMYKAEVLGKVPVIQHFLFGDILKPDPTMTSKIGETVHVQCWADCCGIRVPSAIAAKQARTNELQPDTAKGHYLQKLDSVPVD
ncbi:hypothetical protein FF38_04865 [Lucilia cuprina]|uniref:Serine/threonine-protein phosphatase 2A activator n=1 Tax=Lucilia cuprina TaxID=7375 RepID=A0A0L0BPU0_LUCCU|nr:Serine/threonine-protein phosphatase 2A activator 2 [Lucilia cuprina]KNC22077.1 hypothetical protein FF38_04865 [Lucilia cuprina]